MQESVPPAGLVAIARETTVELSVMTALEAFSTATTGWIDHTAPAAPPPGWVMKARCWATVMLNVALVAPVSPLLAAVSVYPLPWLLMARLLNVAMPLTAFTVVVPERAPLPGFVPMANVTLAVLVVTTWFVASSTMTVTTGEIGALAAVFDGCVPKTSFVGTPEIVNGELVAVARPALAAVSVYPTPELLILRSLNVATPLVALTISVPANVPLLGFVPIATVIGAALVVTVWLFTSWTVTTAAGAIEVLTEVELGCVVKASLLASPTIVNAALVAPVSGLLVATSV